MPDIAVTSPHLELLRSRLAPLRDSLMKHPVYVRIDGIDGLRLFMEHHAFAVWDFMSLLKALQRRLCCVDVPWTPPVDPAACRLVNEIVLGEESDEDGRGGYSSHFDLYRRAMRQCGADLGPIDGLVAAIRGGMDLHSAIESVDVPETVRRFVRRTFEVIGGGDACAIASAFTVGREDLLPDIFRRVVEESGTTPVGELDEFRYYLDRHIEVDGGEHGPMAWRLVDRLCGDDPSRWRAAEEAAARSLEARIILWDGVCERLDGPIVYPA
jgi:hypothetical protein